MARFSLTQTFTPAKPYYYSVHATPPGIGVNDLGGAHPDDDDARRIYNFLMLEIMPCYIVRQTHKSRTLIPNLFYASASSPLIHAIK